MTTFDSTKRSLPDLLKDIITGKQQLPDFQRCWVWGNAWRRANQTTKMERTQLTQDCREAS
jgi:hypothetical protein